MLCCNRLLLWLTLTLCCCASRHRGGPGNDGAGQEHIQGPELPCQQLRSDGPCVRLGGCSLQALPQVSTTRVGALQLLWSVATVHSKYHMNGFARLSTAACHVCLSPSLTHKTQLPNANVLHPHRNMITDITGATSSSDCINPAGFGYSSEGGPS